MSQTFRAGSVEVTLSGELEDFVRRVVERTETAALRSTRAIATEVAREARRKWYGPEGVNRVTGKSGDIQVHETIDVTKGTVTVSVGSTDKRRSGRKLVPEYVHRPGRTSTVKKRVSHDEYWRTPDSLKANYHRQKGDKTPGPFIFVSNPGASDGKKLLPLFVKRPVKKQVNKAARDIARGVADGE